VAEHQGQDRSGRPGGSDVNEVDPEATERGAEAPEPGERRLLHRPVEALRPVGDELAEVREVGPERPPSVLGRVRPACRAQPRSSDNSIMSTVTRRALTAWLIDHGFTELGGKATSHRRFRHESGVVITVPGHGRQNLSQKHVGMIVRQLEALGFDRDTVRRDLNAR